MYKYAYNITMSYFAIVEGANMSEKNEKKERYSYSTQIHERKHACMIINHIQIYLATEQWKVCCDDTMKFDCPDTLSHKQWLSKNVILLPVTCVSYSPFPEYKFINNSRLLTTHNISVKNAAGLTVEWCYTCYIPHIASISLAG